MFPPSPLEEGGSNPDLVLKWTTGRLSPWGSEGQGAAPSPPQSGSFCLSLPPHHLHPGMGHPTISLTLCSL